MIQVTQSRRLWVLGSGLVLAFALLGLRLADLQVWNHEKLAQKAQANVARTDIFEPRRGEIRDVRGNLLATSQSAKKVCADPSLVGPYRAAVARALAPVLQVSEQELAQRLAPVLKTNASGRVFTNQWVELKRKVPVEIWEKARQAMAVSDLGIDERGLSRADRRLCSVVRQKGIFAEDDQLRVYPMQSLAAHVLGFVGRDPEGRDEGKEGVELTLNKYLRGVAGWRVTERDRRNRELVMYREQEVEPRDGLNVVLTIDSGLQLIIEQAMWEAYQKHTPESISVVAVRPKTGEVLAMATLPNFDPNKPGLAEAAARRNRIIADVAEPGSTFKVVVVSAALNEGAVQLSDMFDCENGHFFYGGKSLKDDHPHGLLSVENIIAKSSNIGAAKIAIQKLGPQKLYDYIRRFGFGDPTGIYLQGEVRGIVHPVSKWYPIDLSRIPMGHTIGVTPLQMVMAMSAIANEGQLMQPMLVARVEDDQGRVVFGTSRSRCGRWSSRGPRRKW